MKILILGTVPNDLLNFRADLIRDILKKNCEVVASSSKLDSKSFINVEDLGIFMNQYFLMRHGLNINGRHQNS